MIARLDGLSGLGTIAAVSHRIAHGGAEYAEPVLIGDAILTRLKTLETLAPSHQPHNLRPVRRLREHCAGIPISPVSIQRFTARNRVSHRYSHCPAR